MTRVLVTGASGSLGKRLMARLELEPRVQEVIPTSATSSRELAGWIAASRADAVIDARLGCDPGAWPSALRASVAQTHQLVAALEAPGSPVRRLVLRSSAHRYGPSTAAPAFLTEDMAVPPPRAETVSGALAEAEGLAAGLARRRPGVTVTILRCADVIGPRVGGTHMRLLGLPALPVMLGFDPRWQLLDEHDLLGALVHAAVNDLPGTFNVAADGVLALSEIAELLGKPLVPAIPPLGAGALAGALRRLGLPVPVELVEALRIGRGLDNRRLKATGYTYRYTTREALLRLREHQHALPAGAPGHSASHVAERAGA